MYSFLCVRGDCTRFLGWFEASIFDHRFSVIREGYQKEQDFARGETETGQCLLTCFQCQTVNLTFYAAVAMKPDILFQTSSLCVT